MKQLERILKRSEALEQELIGRMMIDSRYALRAGNLVTQDDFARYGQAYAVVLDAQQHGKNMFVEAETAKVRLADFLEVSSIREPEQVCRDLSEAASLRRMFGVLAKGIEQLPETGVKEYAAGVQTALMGAVAGSEESVSDVAGIIRDYRAAQLVNEERYLSGAKLLGTACGYPSLDEVIDGLRPGHLWVVGGYTSMGKTFVSLNIAAHLAQMGKRTVFYSLEMSRFDLLSRLLGIMTGQNGTKIFKGVPHNARAVDAALETLRDSRLAIHEGMTELANILFSMQSEQLRQPVDLFVVDFIQNVMVKTAKSEYDRVTQAILSFQTLAGKLGVPMIVLSQVSNEGVRNSGEIMPFKSSGGIAAAADLAIEIKNGEHDRDTLMKKLQAGEKVDMQWHIRKNRHGRVGYVDVTFDGTTGVFREGSTLDKVDEPRKPHSQSQSE